MPETAKYLKEAGKFDVVIIDPYWTHLEEKNGDKNRMALVLPGFTDDDRTIEATIYFTRQIVQGGKNKGRPLYEASAEQCCDLGMPRPFNPAQIDKLNMIKVEFVVEAEEYEGKVRYKVQYINPHRREKLDPNAAASMWANLSGGAAPAANTTAAPAKPQERVGADDLDDLPF